MADNQAGSQTRYAPIPGDNGSGRNNEAWGGHGFGYSDDANNERHTTANGYDQDTARYQSMGQAAASAPAYQMDWGQSDQDAQYASDARARQMNSLTQMRGIADGSITSAAQTAGQNQLRAGAQAQVAGAMSARGGSLAQAAAMRQQQAGQGAYMQQGQQQLDAQHAQEMLTARQQYMQATGQMRAGDQAAQGMYQQRSDAQAQQEQAQRDLNDSTSLGYEKMGSDVQNQYLKQQTNDYSLSRGHDQAASAANQADQDRTQQQYAGYASAAAPWLGHLGSDERLKGNVVPLDESSGMERHWDRDVSHARPDVTSGASLSGPTPRYSLGEAAARAPQHDSAPKQRKMSLDELSAAADRMLGNMHAGHSAQLAQGSSTAAAAQRATLSDASAKREAFRMGIDYGLNAGTPGNTAPDWARPEAAAQEKSDAYNERKDVTQTHDVSRDRKPSAGVDTMTNHLANGLAPYEYEYKPEHAASEGQAVGEKNVGPMAQNMASNPVTGAAVMQRPDGMLGIDMKKATKLSLAAAGHNAQKIREQQAQIDALKGGR